MADDLLTRARQAYEAGRLDESEATFRRLAEGDKSEQFEGLYGLGVIRFERGDLDAAERCLRSVVSQQPKHSNAFYFLGEIAERRGQLDTAISRVAMALAMMPTHAGARRRMAALLDGARRTLTPDQEQVKHDAVGPDPVQSRKQLHPPRAPSDPDATVGVVTRLAKGVGPWRGRAASVQIWTFRLQTYDAQGDPGDTFGVEMRGHDISGTLDQGDWVEISDRPSNDGLRPKELHNLTTNDVVKSRMRWFRE